MSDANPAIGSHGTVIEHQPALTPGVFTPVGELGDITMPGLSRNEFDASTHNRDIDSYVTGILRRQPVTFPVFFNMGDSSHLALRDAITGKSRDGWKITSPDGEEWIFSGEITAMNETAPVDGIKTANVTIRPSGPFYLNGDLIGAEVV